MKKKIVAFLMALIVFCVSDISVLANMISDKEEAYMAKLPGVIHEDGSYQFSSEELSRLNEYTSSKNNSYDIMQAIEYASPQYYDAIVIKISKTLEKMKVTKSIGEIVSQNNVRANCHFESTYIPGTYITIGRYGSSLRSISRMERNDMDVPEEWGMYVVINQIFNSARERVGYSVNVSMTAQLSATTIIDPPSGSYYPYGYFEIPWYCTACIAWTKRSAERHATDLTLSYVNPYE